MHEQTKNDIKLIIDDNHQKIKSPKPKIALKQNPNLLKDRREKDVVQINEMLDSLQNQNDELLPFIKALKNKIPDITAETHLTAIYLLLCYNAQTWQSLFLLAKNGFYSQTMTLIRMIKESLMLCDNFALEFKNNINESLKKWFSGSIVSHSVGRNNMSQFIEEYSTYPNLDVKQLQTHIYQMESLIPHNSYASMLENISPFTENFDFEGYTGFYRTLSALKYAMGTMSTFAITLKGVYLILLNDPTSYDKINEILIKYDPMMVNKSLPPDIQKIFKK